MDDVEEPKPHPEGILAALRELAVEAFARRDGVHMLDEPGDVLKLVRSARNQVYKL